MIGVQLAVKDLEEAKEALQELEQRTISSPNMDGMPRGSGSDDAMAEMIAQKEYARRKLEHARGSLECARRGALNVCRRMDGHMRKFCEAYYVEGFPFEVSQVLSGVGRSRCYDYIKMVKGQQEE